MSVKYFMISNNCWGSLCALTKCVDALSSYDSSEGVIVECFCGWSFGKYVIVECLEAGSAGMSSSTVKNHVFAFR